MNKRNITFVNIAFIVVILAFVVVYTRLEGQSERQGRVDAFESMTVAMEKVTANYLEAEQRICDTWQSAIDNRGMSMDQALDYLRAAQSDQEIMAHVIYSDDLTGFSTQGRSNDPENCAVNYRNMNVVDTPSLNQMLEAEDVVNITRAYTNPINGRQSIAFLNRITLKEAGGERPALLMRIAPISRFEDEWVFPTDAYQKAEISTIDAEGNYIIKSRSFKNSSFFEFYKSYNATDSASLQALSEATVTTIGTFEMLNSKGQPCLIGHAPVNATENWAIVTMISMADLTGEKADWMLIVVVSAGLLMLFLFDLMVVQRFNRQLQLAAAEAEQANRAKTEFLSTMSHDIRTPMNAIIGLTTIAGKNAEDPEAVRENLKKINLASNHLLTLINDILDISKVESGKLNMSPVTFSIAESAENLVNLAQPTVREKNIDFNFRVSRFEHEYLYADQLRINQIFINLLSNALKYTEPGGRVWVDLEESEGETPKTVRLVYKVSDTGIGMSPEFMARMYQPFSRQTDSRVNAIQGTGLGLAITRQMIELMDGTIECVSAVGEGTTFTVTLQIPIADKLVEEMVLEPMKVLVADDDEVLLETAKDTLHAIGAQADIARSGNEALEMVMHQHRLQPDYRVVILDWKMPDMDGVAVAREIRQQLGPDVPILIISAYDWSDIEEDARAAGINAFISKPLFRSTLYNKINEMLGLEGEVREQEEDDSDVSGMHILVAEDNDVNWEIISMLLEMHGVTTERAENGQLCVERMARSYPGEFDLIFMDIQMPVMNGLDAARNVRRLTNGVSDIPIIAMTADAFSENVAECLEAGMNGHIAKPVDMKLVMKEIRRIRESGIKN